MKVVSDKVRRASALIDRIEELYQESRREEATNIIRRMYVEAAYDAQEELYAVYGLRLTKKYYRVIT